MVLRLDSRVRSLDGGRMLVGGDPLRVLRLTEAGAVAVAAWLSPLADNESDAAESPALDALLRRLVDAGIAHPTPTPVASWDVTAVVPVRDRPQALDVCLAHLGAMPVVVVDDGSRDAAAVAEVCRRRKARLIRRDQPGGPAVARNTGLATVDTEFVAFVDSDCRPEPGWLALLRGVMADPRVGAVAPRIRAVDVPSLVGRYGAGRSALDMGPGPAWVRPGGRISYVPTAALLVRRAALGAGFDPGLRFGEDVDLIWRLHDAGWRVRYEPASVVRHAEPTRLTELLRRRFDYGGSAGQLARRHPARLAPVVVRPWPTAVTGMALAGRPGLAGALLAADTVRTGRVLVARGVPRCLALRLSLRAALESALTLSRVATMFGSPLMLVGLSRRRWAPAVATLLLIDPSSSWLARGPAVDLARWSAISVADDIAYGAGVWTGAFRAGTLAPLRPARAGSGRG